MIPPFFHFIFRRLISLPVTFFVITAVLYAGIMLTPPETRATIYIPKRLRSDITDAQFNTLIAQTIRRYNLDAPGPVQYGIWLGNLVRGEWGCSPILQTDVLEALLVRTPVTLELTLYSLLFFLPLGLVSGVAALLAAEQPDRPLHPPGGFPGNLNPAFYPCFFLALDILRGAALVSSRATGDLYRSRSKQLRFPFVYGSAHHRRFSK